MLTFIEGHKSMRTPKLQSYCTTNFSTDQEDFECDAGSLDSQI